MSITGFFIVFGIFVVIALLLFDDITLFSADNNIALLPGDNTVLLSTEDKMKKPPSRNQVVSYACSVLD